MIGIRADFFKMLRTTPGTSFVCKTATKDGKTFIVFVPVIDDFLKPTYHMEIPICAR